jgi:hypothetical protein
MFKSQYISIVVQGAINKKETPKCLKSIRKILPNAEIILSTWEGSDVEGLDYDILVLNKDPGASLIEESNHKKIYNNTNRQLLSTQEGLKKATRKYVMKLRSDLIFKNDSFLNYFDKFESRIDDYKLFKHKILGSCLFTKFSIKSRNHYGRINIPFHISDWWFFGLKEDLDAYFLDTKLVEETYFSEYFNDEKNKNKFTPYGKQKIKFSPEQYYGYECFARNFHDIYMEDASDYSDELMEKSRKCLINNFIFLEFKQSGIYLNKYPYSKNEKFSGEQYIGLYNFYRYEKEYQKYCNVNYKITTRITKMYEDEKYGCDLLRIYKHIFKLIDSNFSFSKRLEQLFVGIPISIFNFVIRYFQSIINKKNIDKE